jgi:hypothetical protein
MRRQKGAIEHVDRRTAMNPAALVIASIALATALGAGALAQTTRAQPVSDLDYLKASRCRGIAEGVGVDSAALAAFLKQQDGARASYVVDRAEDERAQARRQAKGYARAQLQAELAGPCQAFTGQAQAVAAHPASEPKG